jgi:hypothetical protein
MGVSPDGGTAADTWRDRFAPQSDRGVLKEERGKHKGSQVIHHQRVSSVCLDEIEAIMVDSVTEKIRVSGPVRHC